MAPPVPPPRPLWEQPIFWGLVGLALMVAGWNLAAWRPVQARGDSGRETLDQLRGMSDDPELTRRLDRMAELAPAPPYQMAGTLVILAGIVVFAAAAVRMYNAPKPPPRDEMPEPDPEASLSPGEQTTP